MLSIVQPVTLALLVVVMSFTGFMAMDEKVEEREQLKQEEVPLYATSPGHPVFGEYVGAHWCPPCMDSASPSLANLKASNPEDFTFVSIFESSSGGWPSDSPINRHDHVMAASSGYPTFSFADEQSGTCYKVGAGGSNYYDADFTTGGCMSSDVADYAIELSIALDTATNEVTITVESTYLGPSSSVTVYLYAAVTEKVGGDAYDNGVRPHHNWREWLLNGNGDGFEQLSLTPNDAVESTWTVPLNTVRSAGGNSQFENFWPVVALMDGPHTSYNDFLTAADLDMAPLIDIGVSDFDADNHNGNLGFVPGDTLDLSVEVTNYGVDPYSDSGEISIYELVGLDEVYVGGSAITNLASGATQTLTIQFDTSDIEPYASGSTTFRAQLSGLTGDRVASNNYADGNALHDMAPVSNQPTSIASTSIERGESIQFESTALSNDMVDDMSTMTPTLHYAESGTDMWDNSWIASSDLVGSGGNARYVFTIDAPLNAEVGDYDLRVRWVDAGGQYGDWLISEEAFELRNALPAVLSSDYPQYAGMPTVKVETQERVSIMGLVYDAETPLSMLQIDSNSPEFIEWDSSSLEIVVEFSEVIRDSQGNPIPQGIFVTINDGDDSNSGMMMFNVVENGAPRWAPVPSQSFNEGGSASFGLSEYLSDTDDNGYPVPVSGLTLELLEISNGALVDASVSGHTLSVSSIDDDSIGVVALTLRASDGVKFSDTVITFHILNVNDAPRMEMAGIDEFTVEIGDRITLELLDLMTDIDDPDEEIWASAMTFVAGAAQFNPITGILTMAWEEAGTEIVTITLEDRHGDASAYTITVTVVDNMPLYWDTDLVATFSTIEYGSDPSVTIENTGQHVLSDIRITWTVCNSITGICHSSGVSHNLGPFIVYPVSGEGLGVGDYITLTAEGEDEDGFDRVTEEQFRVYATEAEEVIEEPDEEEANTNTGGMSSMMSAGLIALGLMLSIALVLALAIVLRRQGLDAESAIDFASEIEAYEEADSYSNDLTGEAPPPPPMIPPLPPEGLPPGWTMEQWHYYGAEYLRRRE
jgi:thiol-disulfide isomerase/thioredoxin|tara:strand:- start:8252 stop:11383 length:3132 start_codon:yes stop_codon:yes gene_type:complete